MSGGSPGVAEGGQFPQPSGSGRGGTLRGMTHFASELTGLLTRTAPLDLPATLPVARPLLAAPVGRLDGSGRLTDRDLLGRLGWVPGTPLLAVINGEGLSIRAAGPGELPLTPDTRGRLLPRPLRYALMLRAGENLLLAEAGGRLLILPISLVLAPYFTPGSTS